MADIATGLGWCILLVLAIQTAWLAVQVTGASAHHLRAALPSNARARLAVVIPAHNEAGGILRTLESIQQQLAPGDRILVVADNCNDDTAAIAQRYGVDVIARRDAVLKGKGFALAFGVDHLRPDPPEVVVFVDADCILAPCALDWLSYRCKANDRPVQAAYLMEADATTTPAKKLAAFAWVVKNWVRPLGASRLGLGCLLYGSGMALPWRLAATAPLATAHLVEDLKLGLDLALAGEMPLFCPSAVVTSRFPDNPGGTLVQRTRWEHGHLDLIVRYVPRLVMHALRRRDVRLLMLALDLAIPPLSLLIVVAASGAITASVALFFSANILLCLAFIAVAIFLLAVLIVAWQKVGRAIIGLHDLHHALYYLLSKIPLYWHFLVKRQKEWIRSDRDRR